jgi:hypothetical protein
MTENNRLRLLELAIQAGACAGIAVSRAREYEQYITPQPDESQPGKPDKAAISSANT